MKIKKVQEIHFGCSLEKDFVYLTVDEQRQVDNNMKEKNEYLQKPSVVVE